MELLNIDLNKRYTFADYLTWLDDKRRELYNGFVKMMTPAPSTKHQIILNEINGQLWQQLKRTKCKVFPAPFDLRFPGKDGNCNDDKIFTVVQPDITIVCDDSKLDSRGCIGSPDFIVEIISISSAKNDVEEKFRLYEENGVREYWIIHPNDATATIFVLENGKYQLKGIYARQNIIKPFIFAGKISIDLEQVFDE